jgi:hypothetical protein
MGVECATFQVSFVSPDASLVGFLDDHDDVVGTSEATRLPGTYVLEDDTAIIEMSLGRDALFVHIALTNTIEVLGVLEGFMLAMAEESAVAIDADVYRGSDVDAFMSVFAEEFAADRAVFERHLGGVALGEGYKSTMDDARSLFFQVHANTRADDESE